MVIGIIASVITVIGFSLLAVIAIKTAILGARIIKNNRRDNMAGVKDSSLTNKAQTPSKAHQIATDRAWGVQNSNGNGSTDPKAALNNKWNGKPINPSELK